MKGIQTTRPLLSVEVFPPKTPEGVTTLLDELEQLKRFPLEYVSVTYGAGGANQDRSLTLTRLILEELDLPVMPHFTCVGSSRVVILEFLRAMESMGITRILALRGDPPQDQTNYQPAADAFRYASDLVTFLRAHSTMQIAVAAYPEKHPQAETLETDMTHLRGKVDAGACKIITQLFYDNSRYLEFVARARRQGITIPIIPGLLPLIQHQQIEKFVKLSQASIPPALMKIIAQTEGNDLAMKTAGMDFARRQIRELLAAGVPGIHFYTLNKSEIALQVLDEFFP